jgi:hypothetical protein
LIPSCFLLDLLESSPFPSPGSNLVSGSDNRAGNGCLLCSYFTSNDVGGKGDAGSGEIGPRYGRSPSAAAITWTR